jgi:hypothetical protein
MIDINKEKAYEKMREVTSKTELAKELGIKIPEDGYWGNMSSRTCGLVGGAIGGFKVRDAILDYENRLADKDK